MTMTDVVPTYSPSMDIQISSNFERLLFDLYGRDGKALAEAMADFRSSGTLKVGANALGGVRELFDAGRLDDEGTLAAIADCRKRFGETLDTHTAVGYAVAAAASARCRRCRWSCWRRRIPPSSPTPCRRRRASGRALPARLADLMERTERVDGLPNDIEALKDLIDERMARCATAAARRRCAHEQRQGHHPRQRPARGGRRDARGRNRRRSASGSPAARATNRPSSTAWRTCSSTWRSRARATRSARAIAEEIENVGGSLNAYTGREITAYHASVLKEDVALGVEMVADILCPRSNVLMADGLIALVCSELNASRKAES